ncbi:acetaldehyde dehydrogenase (acetylating) [Arthrobacter sp. MI7-26]|uniref:acetaldehyde dehydrogenase (acetylating) n=1 Tax=Arthrobacter sp. MI7-26 TaxID=2993653 RepID=UPI002248E74D|nr:acetaldehyde dehydrogenase (acetylating) [Arthrobacter sp. MI7-26]MCX2748087.1 acetaldehyde dehydrogenase (acetylating) [Arthrobacter sp. MI7-26]
MVDKTGVAIVGSGNIGTDLMFKIIRGSESLRVAAMVGIDPESDGLARAARLGIPITSEGVKGLIEMPEFAGVSIILDATSAGAHLANAKLVEPYHRRLIDLTPAAIGPFVIPAVNLNDHLDAPNINMVTCGGQATIPIVAAISRVTPVVYAEIVASVSSRSAGPGTRANIDEFTETTTHAIEQVGKAQRGKAIIILNPADPPLIMRDTVYALIGNADHDAVRASIHEMISEVATYVPGYRRVQEVQFTPIERNDVETLLPNGSAAVDTKVTVFLEVEGAAHYLPAFAGNLDIMTSAAMRVAEKIAKQSQVVAA